MVQNSKITNFKKLLQSKFRTFEFRTNFEKFIFVDLSF